MSNITDRFSMENGPVTSDAPTPMSPQPGNQVGTGAGLVPKTPTGEDRAVANHATKAGVAHATRVGGPGETKIAHSSQSGLDRAANSVRPTGGVPQGTGVRNVTEVANLPASAKAPQRAR